ncbi:hypothetical protein SK128_018661 [Halocaridina rubra]|uniref:Uncharacterized protein n=1 Tax=Halocaridina rubra TaxID=373956 RepID=A0AAN8WIW8_HALRR
MPSEKHICLSICICQMTAILSGVSLLYLAVIVVIPAKNELSLNFNRNPIMCTTTQAIDILASGKKVKCKWSTCSEWCLSKGSGSCMQIMVQARHNGSRVNFRDCVDIADDTCSALDVNVTYTKKCKLGECKDLTGLYHCEREGDNPCAYITPAFECASRSIDRNTVICDEESCKDRLIGVYTCRNGGCQKLKDIKKYYLDCERKCTKLEMRERNVVIFSKERLVATACTSMDSPDNNSIAMVSDRQEWRDKKVGLFIFCTDVLKQTGQTTYDLISYDCFNATLADANEFSTVKDYITLKNIHQSLGNRTEEWIIPPESELSVFNNTQLRINPDGCVNTLRKECTEFFETHAHDGFDGMTQDRFQCYYTDQMNEYVIGKFNPELTQVLLLLCSILPGCLFVFACTCLFICSKSVGVDDEGHLKLILMQGSGGGVSKEPVQFDELL